MHVGINRMCHVTKTRNVYGIPARFPSDVNDITREAREMPMRWPLDTHGIAHGMRTGYLA